MLCRKLGILSFKDLERNFKEIVRSRLIRITIDVDLQRLCGTYLLLPKIPMTSRIMRDSDTEEI